MVQRRHARARDAPGDVVIGILRIALPMLADLVPAGAQDDLDNGKRHGGHAHGAVAAGLVCADLVVLRQNVDEADERQSKRQQLLDGRRGGGATPKAGQAVRNALETRAQTGQEASRRGFKAEKGNQGRRTAPREARQAFLRTHARTPARTWSERWILNHAERLPCCA